jgi:hypothetical protein
VTDEEGGSAITIMKRDGQTVTVAAAEVLAGKVYPV